MKPVSFIEQIAAQPSLESLQSFLNSRRSTDKIRRTLLAAFQDVREYRDAQEWTRAVQICESLAIVGWGDSERVDAISRFNGDHWETYFINSAGEFRFRQARWTKRKAGWSLFNPEYHASPDALEVPSKSWEPFAGQKFPVVACPRLPSQRNFQKQVPIVMGMIGGPGRISARVQELSRELSDHLQRSMRPSKYGDGLDHFYITLHTSYPGVKTANQLKIGSFRPTQKSFSCDLYFDDGFAALRTRDQKGYFVNNITAAISALELKLCKKPIDYDVDLFRSDVSTAFKARRRAKD
jgi:hypothetical protein